MAASSASPLIVRLLSASVAIANRAGSIIRKIMKDGSLNIVQKVSQACNCYRSQPKYRVSFAHTSPILGPLRGQYTGHPSLALEWGYFPTIPQHCYVYYLTWGILGHISQLLLRHKWQSPNSWWKNGTTILSTVFNKFKLQLLHKRAGR